MSHETLGRTVAFRKWLKAPQDGGDVMRRSEINRANGDSFRALRPEIPFDQGDVEFEGAPYADGSFDAILSLGMVERLHHVDRPYQAFGRLAGRGGGGRPITLNPLGRLLSVVLPFHWFNHMALIVARRPGGRNG